MKCSKCYQGTPQIGTTSLTFTREESRIEVKVEGIPAEICPVCGEAYFSEAVAQQVHDLVTPLLDVGEEMSEDAILPPPAIVIQFPPLEPEQMKRAVALV